VEGTPCEQRKLQYYFADTSSYSGLYVRRSVLSHLHNECVNTFVQNVYAKIWSAVSSQRNEKRIYWARNTATYFSV